MFASNPHTVFRHLNNENSVATAKSNTNASTSKTPATSSKQRRALGDISNRKQGNVTGGGNIVLKKTQGLRVQQQRNPLTTKTPGLTKKKEVTFLPRPTQQTKQAAPLVNILPELGSSKSKTLPLPAQKSVIKSKSKASVKKEPVDDIERPAGRLWIDEPDDYSCGSVSLPEIDWAASYQRRQEYMIKAKEEAEAEEDAALHYKFEKALEEDEDGKWSGCLNGNHEFFLQSCC